MEGTILCTVCGASLLPTHACCGNCGSDVEIDKSKTKECPKCSKILVSTVNFCTGCKFKLVDVTKKIICEGKKEDGTKCNRELSPSDRFCSTGGTGLRKKDDPDEKNKDQTEDLDKVQTEDLDGRDDKNRPEQETEKQIIETIENTTQKPTYEPSAEDEEPEKRGLAVVCTHSKFIHEGHSIDSRDGAGDDHIMMKSLWDLYGCHVIDFQDKKNDFYDNKLIGKIEEELKKIENIEIFVCVISSHGEEKEEIQLGTNEQGTFKHYFFTKDGQCSTQDLMNKIANIEKLDSKLKIFVIQACRSRTGAEDQNEDHGVEFELEEGSDLSGGQNDGTVHPDAKGYTPDEDKKNGKSDDKRQNGSSGRPDTKPDVKRPNDGIDQSDAAGYMTSKDEDEDEEVMQQPNVASGRTEAQGEIENEIENSIIDLPPVEVAPHCDDCVVMFASMSGKYAYSRCNDGHYSGGWLIKSVDKILKKYEKGDQAHILDILVEINREVGTRESEVFRDTYEIPDLEIEMENKQPGLKNHINKLREICSKHSSKVEINKCQDELDKLAAEIDKDGHTEVSLNRIEKETNYLTEKLKQKLRRVTLTAQSNFFHNLAFDDEDLFLCKMKEFNS